MRWLRRLRDWLGGYEFNSVHVYCYQCQNGQTLGLVAPWQLDGMVHYWKRHANANSHTIQILRWCDTPLLFKFDCAARNVEEEQYQGKGAD